MNYTKYNRLKEVLFFKEWTQKKLADAMNTKPQTINKICSNERQMSIQRMYEVADILEINVCELLVKNHKRPKKENKNE